MISVLYFSDANVRAQLFDAVSKGSKPVLVTGVRHGKGMAAPQRREPFVSLEAQFGHLFDQVLVADDGSVEGMWRDPLGDLADALFPKDRAAAWAAATGYLLLKSRQPAATVKKQGAPIDDRWFVQQALAQNIPGISAPDPKLRPGTRASQRHKTTDPEPTSPSGKRIEDEDTNPRSRPLPKATGEKDPWAVLGIAPGTPKDEAKKAFRALMTQYHPDKVSHLAAEFRELADRRTREIMEAWELVEKS